MHLLSFFSSVSGHSPVSSVTLLIESGEGKCFSVIKSKLGVAKRKLKAKG